MKMNRLEATIGGSEPMFNPSSNSLRYTGILRLMSSTKPPKHLDNYLNFLIHLETQNLDKTLGDLPETQANEQQR